MYENAEQHYNGEVNRLMFDSAPAIGWRSNSGQVSLPSLASVL